MDEQERVELLKSREIVSQMGAEQVVNFDKALLTLTTGGLGLSVLFLTEFFDDRSIAEVIFLYFSWTAWTLSLVFNMISYLTSWKDSERAVEIIDNRMEEKSANEVNTWRIVTIWLNWSSFAGFVLGAVLFLIFVSLNVQ
jgi:hypothetical protein